MLQVSLAPLDAALSLAQPAGYGFDRDSGISPATMTFILTAFQPILVPVGVSFKINDFIEFCRRLICYGQKYYEGHIVND
jgi:hypothetical protein